MQNKTAWVAGAAILVVALAVLFLFSSTATTVNTNNTNTTDTSGITATSSEPTADTSTQNGVTGTTGKKPVVTATGFASVTSTTAVIVGTVIPQSSATSYWFQYGTTLNLGSSTEMNVTPAEGTSALGAAAYIQGLLPSTQYYFRLAAKNAAGIVYSGPYKLITNAK